MKQVKFCRNLSSFNDPEVESCHKNIYVGKEENVDNACYFMLSGRISRNIGENIFRSYTGTTSENTDFHVLVPFVNCACLTTRWKYDVIYLTFLALDVIL